VEVVGGKDSGEDGVKSRLRVLENPHLSVEGSRKAPLLAQTTREKWGTRLVRINEWKWWEEKIRDKTG
jgi:hypothetical protein